MTKEHSEKESKNKKDSEKDITIKRQELSALIGENLQLNMNLLTEMSETFLINLGNEQTESEKLNLAFEFMHSIQSLSKKWEADTYFLNDKHKEVEGKDV